MTEKFDAHILEQRLKLLTSLKIKAGIPANATYPGGKKVVEVAGYQEYGTSRIPPRPFFRSAIKKGENRWKEITIKGARAALHGKLSAQNAMEQVAMSVAGDIKESIISWSEPPLNSKTIKKKGSKKPLVDTGTMLKSVAGVVEKI